MSRVEDGGAAFPTETRLETGGIAIKGGLTIRDWFAGQALAGMVQTIMCGSEEDIIKVAEYSYKYADAMLKERQK